MMYAVSSLVSNLMHRGLLLEMVEIESNTSVESFMARPTYRGIVCLERQEAGNVRATLLLPGRLYPAFCRKCRKCVR